jgi:hypothetical protein
MIRELIGHQWGFVAAIDRLDNLHRVVVTVVLENGSNKGVVDLGGL